MIKCFHNGSIIGNITELGAHIIVTTVYFGSQSNSEYQQKAEDAKARVHTVDETRNQLQQEEIETKARLERQGNKF